MSARDVAAVEVPWRLRVRPKDARGYPIPFIVFVDAKGQPHFQINDAIKLARCIREDRCPLCGQELGRLRVFIGGVGAAFHEHGAYLDPPTHRECASYALKVCPYLAAPRYGRRLDGRTLSDASEPMVLIHDDTVDDARPELFVAVTSHATRRVPGTDYVRPAKPVRGVTYWRRGASVPAAEAMPIVEAALAAIAQEHPR